MGKDTASLREICGVPISSSGIGALVVDKKSYNSGS